MEVLPKVDRKGGSTLWGSKTLQSMQSVTSSSLFLLGLNNLRCLRSA